MKKKIIVILIAVTMVLTIGVMTGCDNTPDPNAALRQQIEQLQTELLSLSDDVENGNGHLSGCTCNCNAELLSQLNALSIRLGELEAQLSATEAELLGKIANLEAQLNELRKQLEGASMERGYSECGRFSLAISVDRATATHGQKIVASAVLKNNSGQSQNISVQYNLVSFIHMEGWLVWIDRAVAKEPWNEFFEEDGILTSSETYWVEQEQESGTYVLQAMATFFLNFGQQSEEKITVKSNKINIVIQ